MGIIIASFYLLSPLIIILTQYRDYYPTNVPVFILFISTYVILGASLSHLIKILIAILSISIYLPLIIFKQAITKPIIVDISVCILISLIVLYGISRQVEVARRSQDHIVHKSSEQRIEVEKKCDRVDWLLRNILPEHVIEVLCQLGGSYSRNHPCVGVLFASLINFHVLYEEQYEGEKFYSRILNEFYGDIEELFLDRRFLKIEKIKTIGSTFMAASGIQTDSNDQKPLDFDVFRERVQNLNMSQQGEDELQLPVFRPLHIERMKNVSILFADIVGFTSMSSNKSASQLVSLLSDLYGRFDMLCVQMSCEKIATLGDCYYCVSGCPERREDHGKSCVLLGLGMINAIEEFDHDNNEQVDMRVGVHLGSVNCGIVRTKKI
ncbi:unnamed protein product [Rotaria sp. Silwood2]|nr:unnamed protein product [Rotaria sp. Silwood2]